MSFFIPLSCAPRFGVSRFGISRSRALKSGALSFLAATLALGALAAPVWAQPPVVEMEDVLQGVTGETSAARYKKAWEELRALHKDAEKTAPADTIKIYREFLAQNPRLTPLVGVEIHSRIAQMFFKGLGQNDQAHDTYLQAETLYAKDRPALLDALLRHARWLNIVTRHEDALKLLETHWPAIRQSWTHLAVPLLEQGEIAFRMKGGGQNHRAFLESVLRAFPELPGGDKANWDGLFYERLITSLLESKGEDAAKDKTRALGWAKLRFMAAPYESGAITRASQMLTRTWSALEPEKTGLLAFAGAQKNAEAPNPLREIALPPLEIEDLAARVQNLGAGNSASQITLLLWAQKPNSAMKLAQSQFNSSSKETSARGALEVARVFKAHDLNLLRANAFLKWSATKEGPNPIEAFLQSVQDAPEAALPAA